MKTYKYVVLVLIALAIGLIVVWNGSPKNSKNNHQRFFGENVTALTETAKDFMNQNSIVSVTRNDSVIFGLSYNIKRSFNQENDDSVTFEVPRGIFDEETFWGKDASKIISTVGTGSVKLNDFLKLCKMNSSEVSKWSKFLSKYNMHQIRPMQITLQNSCSIYHYSMET